MSWKDVIVICLIVGALVVAAVARHFLGNVLFVVEHLIAAAFAYMPSLVHFAASLVE